MKLWNKLKEIRNNYKAELKKKQEERVSFENDLRAATAQATAELVGVERELDRTNQDIAAMEGQIAQAENYRKKVSISCAKLPIPQTNTSYQYLVPIPRTNTSYQYLVPIPRTNTSHQYLRPIPRTNTSYQYLRPIGRVIFQVDNQDV